MKHEEGNWVSYRERFGLLESDEIDLHFGKSDPSAASYDERMARIEEIVRDSLRKAQENGRPYLMFIHGYSTSRPGKVTARSVVRGFMRSAESTPFIMKAESIQHCTVYIAKIRQNNKPSSES